VLREQFKKYPPEKASEISGVPAATIRRIAKEFAEAAMVGANVSIEGMQIRHRPVQAGGGPERGAIAHHNGYHTGYTINLLNFVLGAYDAFGSGVMIPLDLRYQEDLPAFKLGPVKDHDGFASPRSWALPYGKFPLPDVKHPREKDLRDLFLMEMDTPIWGVSDREEVLRKAKIDPTIEVVLNYGCDSVLTYVNPRDQAKFLKKVPFVVDFELFGTEFNEGFADIVLPDQCYLEYSDWGSSIGGFFGQTSLLEEPWTFQITQRTVEPQYSRRYVMDVTMDILDRIGLRAKFNEYLNNYINLNETLKLKPTDKLTWEQLGDRVVKSYFGPEHDWEWFKKHGFITWPKTPQEFYSSSLSSDLRIPIYREFMIDLGEKIRKVVEELDMEINWQQYTAYPEWFPCPPHQVKDPQYDLYCFCYRDPLHMNAVSMEQPWLDEASSTNPFTYNITMNIDMAQQKGLKEGDTIELESDKGNKVQGVLHLREGQLPQAVAIMGSAGHWAKGQPIARGKGINFNSLMEVRWSECDPICFILECCVKVKATKIK
jgi:molybdopterin-containing oxidoreductase family molybdopterin binding subunit